MNPTDMDPERFAEDADAEDVLSQVLEAGEKVLWVGEADRATWRRFLSWGLGCIPFVGATVVLLAATLIAATLFTRSALEGRYRFEDALPVALGGLLLFLLVYPIVTGELARRSRRYVITTQRALVIEPRRIEAVVELGTIVAVAPHLGLFDDSPSGVELRAKDGHAAIVFRDLADPTGARAAVESALAAARAL